ncbi:MAG: hypothetical protein AB1Z23_04020 [Eubacteriales bacterium]
MKKIKFIIKLIAFLCIFSVLLGSISYIVRPDSDMKIRYAGFYAEDKDTIDAIMIGPSSVSPLIAAPYLWNEYGIAVYPLSTNAQPVASVKYIIEEARKTQKDALFIVDTTMFMVETETLLTEPRIRNVVDNMKYSMTRFRAINEMVQDKSQRIDYYFDISKYHSTILGEDGVEKGDFKYFNFESPSTYKGYLFVEAVDLFEPINFSGIADTKPIPESAEIELQELMEYCTENEVNVLFITCPYIATEDNKMKHNYMASLANENGYEYLDFNDLYQAMNIDFERDFYNANHFNVYGAEKFSDYLGSYLVQNYDMKDKRGDEKYSSWDESYIVWQEKAEETKEKIDKNLNILKNR